MNLKHYNFNWDNKVKVTAKDGNYLWIAEGNNLRKVSIYNLNQTFYNIDVNADKIIDLKVTGNFIYALVEDEDLIGIRVGTANPLTNVSEISKPSIDENPIKSEVIGNNWFVLLPGIESGLEGKVLRISGTNYQETIDLETKNVVDLTTDGTNVWLVSNTNPAKCIKIYYDGIGWRKEIYTVF